MTKYNRAFRYAGCKQFLINKVNQLIKEHKPEYNMYVEPFLGSGSILYNLETFDSDNRNIKYVGSDLDKAVMLMHNALAKYPYEEYLATLNFVMNNFGNIKENKEAYYNYRAWWNKTYWNWNGFLKYTDILNLSQTRIVFEDDVLMKESGLYLLLLANSCINSMLRFGPNGMNQSFGHRHYIIDETTYNNLHKRAESSELFIQDYRQTLDFALDQLPYCANGAVFFFDPPYESTVMSYNGAFKRTEFISELLKLKDINALTIYTDIENKESDKLLDFGWKKETIRTMRTICPSKSSEITNTEVIYYKG